MGEPVGWIYEDDEGRMMFSQMPQNSPLWEPVYRAKKQWQGLTEYEVGFLTVFDGLYDVEVPLLANFIRHIEAKLKKKNT